MISWLWCWANHPIRFWRRFWCSRSLLRRKRLPRASHQRNRSRICLKSIRERKVNQKLARAIKSNLVSSVYIARLTPFVQQNETKVKNTNRDLVKSEDNYAKDLVLAVKTFIINDVMRFVRFTGDLPDVPRFFSSNLGRRVNLTSIRRRLLRNIFLNVAVMSPSSRSINHKSDQDSGSASSFFRTPVEGFLPLPRKLY